MNQSAQASQLENFVETETYRKVKDAVLHAVSLQRAVLVFGKAGLGKTVSLLKIASETGAPMFEVDDTNKGTGAMLESFITAFGYSPHGRTTRDLLYQCKKVAALDSFALLYGSRGLSPDQYRQSRLLLVDEYQNLQPVALRLLLGLCLEAQLPLLVCGNSETLASRSREAKLAVEQLRHRLLLRFEVGKPSYRDCRDIGILFNVEGKEAYAAISAFGSRTSLRELVDMLQKAAIMTGGEGSIKHHTIESALLAYGGQKFLPLLSPTAAHVAEISEETGSPKRIAKTA
jgi:DNA transposition AAA+ family ATPase